MFITFALDIKRFYVHILDVLFQLLPLDLNFQLNSFLAAQLVFHQKFKTAFLHSIEWILYQFSFFYYVLTQIF